MGPKKKFRQKSILIFFFSFSCFFWSLTRFDSCDHPWPPITHLKNIHMKKPKKIHKSKKSKKNQKSAPKRHLKVKIWVQKKNFAKNRFWFFFSPFHVFFGPWHVLTHMTTHDHPWPISKTCIWKNQKKPKNPKNPK